MECTGEDDGMKSWEHGVAKNRIVIVRVIRALGGF
jgi:hypothetical protein